MPAYLYSLQFWFWPFLWSRFACESPPIGSKEPGQEIHILNDLTLICGAMTTKPMLVTRICLLFMGRVTGALQDGDRHREGGRRWRRKGRAQIGGQLGKAENDTKGDGYK